MKNRRWILLTAVICAFTLLFSAAAAEVTEYAWGSTEEEIEAAEGIDYEEDDSSSPGYLIMRYQDREKDGLETTMSLVFSNGKLFARLYGFLDNAEEAYAHFEETYDAAYGNGGNNPELAVQGFTLLGLELTEELLEDYVNAEILRYRTWQSDDECIVLFVHETQENLNAGVFQIRLPEPEPEEETAAE